MRDASRREIQEFKKAYCRNQENRINIKRDFNVEVESFEELLHGKIISSYATGGRDIQNSFIMFRVIDDKRKTEYFPVFSETIGRQLLNEWNMKVPRKRSIFAEDNNGATRGNGGRHTNVNNADNLNLRKMILLIRSLMILHIDEPRPMDGSFKNIYEKLENNPGEDVKEFQIKSVNTALKSYLKKDINIRNENFKNLQEYIQYLQSDLNVRQLKNFNFESLRNRLVLGYPDEQIYF